MGLFSIFGKGQKDVRIESTNDIKGDTCVIVKGSFAAGKQPGTGIIDTGEVFPSYIFRNGVCAEEIAEGKIDIAKVSENGKYRLDILSFYKELMDVLISIPRDGFVLKVSISLYPIEDSGVLDSLVGKMPAVTVKKGNYIERCVTASMIGEYIAPAISGKIGKIVEGMAPDDIYENREEIDTSIVKIPEFEELGFQARTAFTRAYKKTE